MSLRECPSCGIEVEEQLAACSICGYEFPQKPKINLRLIAVILILLFIYPVIKIFC